MKKALRIYWPSVLAFVILFAVYCLNFKNIDCLAIIYDEFGYWGNAAIVAGYDWKALLAVTPFYSMGYSLTLVPLFKLGLELPSMYRIAILMNMAYVWISYLCALYAAGKLFPDLDVRLRQLAGFVCAASAAMLYYSQIAWCETFLAMLMWCLVALFIRLEYKWTYAALPAIVIDAILIYLTHQRAILLIPLTIGVLILICIQKRKFISAGAVILFAIMCLAGYRYLHSWQEEAVFSASELVMSNGNNVKVSSSLASGYLGKVLNAPGQFAVSLLCKVGVVMLTACFTAVIAYKKQLISFIHKDFSFWGSRSFILLSALIMLVLQSIQMSVNGRKDHFIYSRYMDFAIFPLALLGVCEFLCHFRQYKRLYTLSIALSLPLFVLSMYSIQALDGVYIEPGTPLWGSLIECYGIDNVYTAGLVLIEICLLILIAYIVMAKKSGLKQICIYLLLILFFQLPAYQYNTNRTIRTRDWEYSHISSHIEVLKDYPDDRIFWLLPDSQDDITHDIQMVGELQAFFYDRPMYTLEALENLKDDDFIISQTAIKDKDHFELVIDQTFKLYRYHS